MMAQALLLAAALVLVASPAHARDRFTDAYDAEIREAADRWLAGVDWRLYKAQLYQESQLDPGAESPVGAQGIAQFMPGTWRNIAPQLGVGHASPHAVEPAIKAGAYYMAWLRRQWSTPRPEADRHSLALASYNAGLGNLLSAQRACDGATLYADVVVCLPEITGHHAKETETYVQRIWRWFTEMVIRR